MKLTKRMLQPKVNDIYYNPNRSDPAITIVSDVTKTYVTIESYKRTSIEQLSIEEFKTCARRTSKNIVHRDTIFIPYDSKKP